MSYFDFKTEIRKVVEKYKDDKIMLDALYQFAIIPTAMAAGYGINENYPYIQENLEFTYNLSYNEAKKYVEILASEMRIFQEKGIFGWRNRAGYALRNIIIDTIYDEYYGKLNQHIISQEQFNDEDVKYFSSILTYTKNDRLKEILAQYNAFSGKIATDEFITKLRRLGLVKKLLWIKANNRGSEQLYLIPHYAYRLEENINLDEFVESHKPNIRELEQEISLLISKRMWKQLYALELLLNSENNIAYWGIPWENLKLIKKILGKHPFTPSRYESQVFALNPFIIEDVGTIINNLKNQLTEKYPPQINELLEKLRQNFHGEFEFFEEKENSWLVQYSNGEIEEEVILLLTPWITSCIFNEMRKKSDTPYFVIITGDIGKPVISDFVKTFRMDGKQAIYLLTEHENQVVFGDISQLQKLLLNEFSKKLFKNKKITYGQAKLEENTVQKKVGKRENGETQTKLLTEKKEVPSGKTRYNGENSRKEKILLGYNENNEKIYWEPTNPEILNSHFVIIGSTGAGKTETIRSIALELQKHNFPVLMIDFHGDMIDNLKNKIPIKDYKIGHSEGAFIDPLELDPNWSLHPVDVKHAFVDAFKVYFPNMGERQYYNLAKIIEDAFRRHGITSDKSTWKEIDFREIASDIKDSDLEHFFLKFFDYELFWGKDKISINDVFSGVTHIDLSPLKRNDKLKQLFADLFLRKIFYTVSSMGKITKADYNPVRLFIIIDEASKLSKEDKKHNAKGVLAEYFKEARGYGLSMIIATQLITEFSQEILGNAYTKLCMKALDKKEAEKNAKHFGINPETLLNLQKGEGILSKGNEIVGKIKIVPSWERT